ncbi:MAG TPA: hypothetical protein VHH36_00775, partial [Candidatus Thermoplasmatota archaeon]|nr:hypothetical protein [Candidatus Thermoplasmatota archaeon]
EDFNLSVALVAHRFRDGNVTLELRVENANDQPKRLEYVHVRARGDEAEGAASVDYIFLQPEEDVTLGPRATQTLALTSGDRPSVDPWGAVVVYYRVVHGPGDEDQDNLTILLPPGYPQRPS